MSVSHPSARVSVSGWGVEISDMPDSYLEQVLELEEPPTLEQSVAIMNEAYGKMLFSKTGHQRSRRPDPAPRRRSADRE